MITQIKTSAKSTTFDVDGKTVVLTIMSGAVPKLQCGKIHKLYPKNPKYNDFDIRIERFAHQIGQDPIQGPTLSDLPDNALEDFMKEIT
jgi:hypothetical protein